ncbi:MAG TPA: hypothetical protein VMA30_01725 [Xanthobacteraceae bacterium]|nr:hypothetical protein [Xanthobacteraceae bacterium]
MVRLLPSRLFEFPGLWICRHTPVRYQVTEIHYLFTIAPRRRPGPEFRRASPARRRRARRKIGRVGYPAKFTRRSARGESAETADSPVANCGNDGQAIG